MPAHLGSNPWPHWGRVSHAARVFGRPALRPRTARLTAPDSPPNGPDGGAGDRRLRPWYLTRGWIMSHLYMQFGINTVKSLNLWLSGLMVVWSYGCPTLWLSDLMVVWLKLSTYGWTLWLSSENAELMVLPYGCPCWWLSCWWLSANLWRVSLCPSGTELGEWTIFGTCVSWLNICLYWICIANFLGMKVSYTCSNW